ncbi:NAD(P)H-dependent flavin oxidoreductase [Chitinophaga pinensis]|uniref:Nitronate monooxygenase n=1 Tax=Chitinophaga pinensis (strain ATCC 43595 / DSM 2588 / LMG 13176 / NBRC 15968 / NCIMB 11800 / UQM 2034) TaxID=485918 RepID=A0A979GAJ6_CHIPD|nr:nitronate monooxygenase [Chitinophaga pinensis]ACU63779.1 2-nitropropane dioxygenase NPD [Chitinophaga pinensis DSM 2588]
MMEWKNELSALLNIDYPIIQAPMLGITTPEMVAAVAEKGGLGSLPVGGLSPDRTRELIRKTKSLTAKPFAVNLFTNGVPDYSRADAEAMQDFLEAFSKENQLGFERLSLDALRFYSYKEQIDILIAEAIPVVSFTFGIPDAESMTALKQKGIVLVGTATSVQEAVLVEKAGADAVVAQGIEAGGHRGSFLDDEPLPMVGTFVLVPEIVAHVKIPVIAAGGIRGGSTIRAAFQLGAKAVQIGTAFIASQESLAIASYKTALPKAQVTDSALTRAFSGRWARGIRNQFMDTVEASGLKIPPYPIQNSITAGLRAKAQQADRKEFTNMWAGQASAGAENRSSADIFLQLVAQAEGL